MNKVSGDGYNLILCEFNKNETSPESFWHILESPYSTTVGTGILKGGLTDPWVKKEGRDNNRVAINCKNIASTLYLQTDPGARSNIALI